MQMEGVRLVVNKGLSNHFQVGQVPFTLENFYQHESEQVLLSFLFPCARNLFE